MVRELQILQGIPTHMMKSRHQNPFQPFLRPSLPLPPYRNHPLVQGAAFWSLNMPPHRFLSVLQPTSRPGKLHWSAQPDEILAFPKSPAQITEAQAREGCQSLPLLSLHSHSPFLLQCRNHSPLFCILNTSVPVCFPQNTMRPRKRSNCVFSHTF